MTENGCSVNLSSTIDNTKVRPGWSLKAYREKYYGVSRVLRLTWGKTQVVHERNEDHTCEKRIDVVWKTLATVFKVVEVAGVRSRRLFRLSWRRNAVIMQQKAPHNREDVGVYIRSRDV